MKVKKLKALPEKKKKTGKKVDRGATLLLLVVFIAIRTTPCNQTCLTFSFVVFIAFKDDGGAGNSELHLHGYIWF